MPVGPVVRSELDQARDDVVGACLARWEEEQDNARLRLALKSAQRRALRRLPHEREGLIFRLEQDNKQLHAFVEIANEAARVQREAWEGAQDELERLRARVDELEAERHSTNDALAERSADKLTALFAPTQVLREESYAEAVPTRVQAMRALLDGQRAAVEDPHDGPLHHSYRVPRDLPEMGSR
jgi:chromosome segregation ATPase